MATDFQAALDTPAGRRKGKTPAQLKAEAARRGEGEGGEEDGGGSSGDGGAGGDESGGESDDGEEGWGSDEF